jgi:hypothetical protein
MSRVSRNFLVCFQRLTIALGGSTRHICDMAQLKNIRIDDVIVEYGAGVRVMLFKRSEPASEPASDPRWDRVAMRLARELARKQLEDPTLYREVRDALIVDTVAAHRETEPNKLKEVVVPSTARTFGLSQKTVWNVLGAMKRKKLQP